MGTFRDEIETTQALTPETPSTACVFPEDYESQPATTPLTPKVSRDQFICYQDPNKDKALIQSALKDVQYMLLQQTTLQQEATAHGNSPEQERALQQIEEQIREKKAQSARLDAIRFAERSAFEKNVLESVANNS